MLKLGIDQSAEPGKCGSCQYFEHRQENYDTWGRCSFKLPPWTSKLWDDPTASYENDPCTVNDTDSCSLYEAKHIADKPVEFTQERTWKAGQPSTWVKKI